MNLIDVGRSRLLSRFEVAPSVTLDTIVLIGIERATRRMQALLTRPEQSAQRPTFRRAFSL